MRRLAIVSVLALVVTACAASTAPDDATTTTAPPDPTTTVAPSTTAASSGSSTEACVSTIEQAVAALGELVTVYARTQPLDQESAEFATALAELEALDDETRRLMATAADLGCDEATVLDTIETAAAPLDAGFADQFDEPVRRSALQAWLAATPATVDGEALPPYGQGDDLAVGMTMPAATGMDLDGAPIAIARDGRPKAIMFVAHWCPHCRDEVLEMAGWLAGADLPGDVELITVATGTDPTRDNYPPAEWFASAGWPQPVFDDRGNVVADAFGLTAYPYWVFVDSDGLVVSRSTGALGLDVIIPRLDALSAS